MWKHFFERARVAALYVQNEAERFSEFSINKKHLPLGLILESHSLPAKELARLWIDTNPFRVEAERCMAMGKQPTSQDITLIFSAKRAGNFTYDESKTFGNNYKVTRHPLLGLIRESEDLALSALP